LQRNIPAYVGLRNYGDSAGLHPGLSGLREKRNLLSRINLICSVQSHFEKYSAWLVGQIISTNSPVPPHTEGRFAIVTDVGCGMRWTRQRRAREVIAGRVERPVSDDRAHRREMLLRTEKSCGPDAPALASSWRILSAQPGADKTLIRKRR
jgi:hypothetical protein